MLIPELRRRGIFWDDFHVSGGTYRENLYELEGQHEPPHDHPAAAMIWRAPACGDAPSPDNGSASKMNRHLSNEDAQVLLDPTSLQLS